MPIHTIWHLTTLLYHTAATLEPPMSRLPLTSQHKGKSQPFTWQLTKCSPAIEDSWNADYVDLSPLDGLVTHIAGQLDTQRLCLYGRYCAIVQSSGMGKSRLLDEFSKHFFMIPINLRSPSAGGLSYLIAVASRAC
jgi:hypothetical protein